MLEIDRKLSRVAILSVLVLAAFRNSGKKKEIADEDVFEQFKKLVSAGKIDLKDFSLDFGFSEDICRFLFNLSMAGYTNSRRSMSYLEDGYEFCRLHCLQAISQPETAKEMSSLLNFFELHSEILYKKGDFDVCTNPK